MSTTFDDYLATEQAHAEYIDDEVRMNPPSRRHVRIGRFLTIALQEACPPEYEVLPEAGWRIAPRTVLEPDVMVALIDAPSTDMLTVPPLLVVEIVSPSSRDMDWGRKRDMYLAAGVHYWIIDDGLWVVSGASEKLRGVQQLAEPFPVTIDVEALLDL